MRKTVVGTALATLALAAAAPAAAQEVAPPPKVQLIVGMGELSARILDRGYNGELSEARHGATTGLTVGAQVATPLRGVGLRTTFGYARPGLFQIEEGYGSQYRTSVKSLNLDAIIQGPRVLDLRPYLVAGVGMEHFDFKQSHLSEGGEEVVPGDKLFANARLGAGVAWDVGRYDLYVEGVGTRGPRVSSFRERGGSQGDDWGGSFTVGVRIPIR
ncbi:MAG TPA: hypothetical protein VHG91_07050 [Longimicrobium sp.]|nr:hypothetical protein [Longimicrobium sp.]